MIVRNDDVAADTSLSHLEKFCAVCDRAGVRIMHAVTVAGRCIPVQRDMENTEILSLVRGRNFSDRPDLIDFLRSRRDLIAVHGLYHTHRPSLPEIKTADAILASLGLLPAYFVPPFNEGEYGSNAAHLLVSAGEAFKIESAIVRKQRVPADVQVGYLHSWRFDPDCELKYRHPKMKRQFTLEDLETVLSRA